jgi:hypothetical protein
MRVVLVGQIRKNNKNVKAGLAPHPYVRACVSMVNKGAYRADQLTRGQERLRITPTPFHTEEHMEHLIDGLVSVRAQLGWPTASSVLRSPRANSEVNAELV